MILFMTWDGNLMVQKIEISSKEFIWNPLNNSLAVLAKDSFFLLQYNQEKVEQALEGVDGSGNIPEELEDGVEESFEVVGEFQEKVLSGLWINGTFFFLNEVGKLNFVCGERVFNYSFL